jgi:hypothetical protein
MISDTASMRGSAWERIEATRFAGISELRIRAAVDRQPTDQGPFSGANAKITSCRRTSCLPRPCG